MYHRKLTQLQGPLLPVPSLFFLNLPWRANDTNVRLCQTSLFFYFSRSFISLLNNIGPSIDLWGTCASKFPTFWEGIICSTLLFPVFQTIINLWKVFPLILKPPQLLFRTVAEGSYLKHVFGFGFFFFWMHAALYLLKDCFLSVSFKSVSWVIKMVFILPWYVTVIHVPACSSFYYILC